MNIKTFIALIVLLAGLIGAAMFLNKKPEPRVRVAGVTAGDLVFRELDVNNVNAIDLALMASTIRLARAESGWVSQTLHNYPAEFSALAGFLRKLNDLKAGQVLREGEASASELGLDAAAPGSETIAVTLSYANGKAPVAFTLGAMKQGTMASPMGMAPPQGRFLRVADGPILQVNETFMELGGTAEDWIKRELLQVNADQLASVEVTASNTTFVLSQDSAGPYKLADLAEGEKVDDAAAARLFQGIQWLRFDTLVDPAQSDADAGLLEFDTVKYTTKTGVVYQLEVSRPDAMSSRTLRIKVSDVSEGGANAAVIEELNKKFAGWRYRVSAGLLANVIVSRDSLIAKPVEGGSSTETPFLNDQKKDQQVVEEVAEE